jgi:transposase-like protein
MVRRVIEEGASRSAVAKTFGVCGKTVSKWVDRFLAEGPKGLRERSWRPHRLYRPVDGGRVELPIGGIGQQVRQAPVDDDRTRR